VTFLQLNELELVEDLWIEENTNEVITLMMTDFITRLMLSKYYINVFCGNTALDCLI